MRGNLKIGVRYWLVDLRLRGLVSTFEWDGVAESFKFFRRGLIHLTESAARQHAEALLSFTQQTEKKGT